MVLQDTYKFLGTRGHIKTVCVKKNAGINCFFNYFWLLSTFLIAKHVYYRLKVIKNKLELFNLSYYNILNLGTPPEK